MPNSKQNSSAQRRRIISLGGDVVDAGVVSDGVDVDVGVDGDKSAAFPKVGVLFPLPRA